MNIRIMSLIAGLLISYSAHAVQCDEPKNEYETRMCIGNELRDSDRVINSIYTKVMAMRDNAGKARLRTEQRAWLKERDHLCHLDNKISNREAWIENILNDDAKTICVVHLTRTRIATLQAMQNPSAAVPSAPEIQPQKMPGTAYDGKPSTIHSSGKWYFEFTLNPAAIAAIMPTVIVLGVSDGEHITGRMENITNYNPTDSERIGIAADLDNGKLYISRNGAWVGGAPGSNRGSDLKLGRNFYAVAMISAKEQFEKMLESGAFVPNYGDHPLAYALPEGYSPWRNQNLR